MRWHTTMSPNRTLAIAFVVFAVLQTAAPMVIQKATRAIVYDDVLHGAVASCVVAAIVGASCQATRRQFSTVTMIFFYIGLALLAAFDIWIEGVIAATC